MHIAYLGPAGTFSEAAARLFGNTQDRYEPFASTDQVLEAVETGSATHAVLPIENSAEGSVDHTLDLLLETTKQISAEVVLRIHHQLLSRETTLTTIREVIAHPQALGQCRHWLDSHLPEATQSVAQSNTQGAVIASEKDGVAAIASMEAGAIYRLNTLAKNIEDNKNNVTRFIILSETSQPPTKNDRTSLVCSVANHAGSLYELLGIFARAHINMTRLESRPSNNGLWDFNFFIDIDGHASENKIAAALDEVRAMASFMRVIGSYPKSEL